MLNLYPDDQYETYPTSTTTESNVGQPNANALNSTSTSGDTTSSASSADMNAGPHRSNLANKLDPRVDSDLGNIETASLTDNTERKMGNKTDSNYRQ